MIVLTRDRRITLVNTRAIQWLADYFGSRSLPANRLSEGLQPFSLEPLGLSHREAEVLAWVAQGKTNIEIGTILGMSPRTVQKHLEHIYQKLGVETRTAAAAKAYEIASAACK